MQQEYTLMGEKSVLGVKIERKVIISTMLKQKKSYKVYRFSKSLILKRVRNLMCLT